MAHYIIEVTVAKDFSNPHCHGMVAIRPDHPYVPDFMVSTMGRAIKFDSYQEAVDFKQDVVDGRFGHYFLYQVNIVETL